MINEGTAAENNNKLPSILNKNYALDTTINQIKNYTN
jgi:hypothetical protein